MLRCYYWCAVIVTILVCTCLRCDKPINQPARNRQCWITFNINKRFWTLCYRLKRITLHSSRSTLSTTTTPGTARRPARNTTRTTQADLPTNLEPFSIINRHTSSSLPRKYALVSRQLWTFIKRNHFVTITSNNFSLALLMSKTCLK